MEIGDLNKDKWRSFPLNPQYAVSELGEVLNLKRGSLVSSFIDRDYFYLHVNVDKKLVKFRRNRLVALTWCDSPENWRDLQVNHKDGVKTNDHYLNLEWCDGNHNMQHANETGLLSFSRDYLVMDYVQRKVTICKGCVQAESLSGIPRTTIMSRINNNDPSMIYGFSFMLLDKANELSFPEYTREEIEASIDLENRRLKRASMYTVKDYAQDVIKSFHTVPEVLEYTGLTANEFQYLICKKRLRPLRGFSVRHELDERDFPVLTDEELWLNLNRSNCSTSAGVKVTDTLTNTIQRYVNRSEVAKVFNIALSTVDYQMKNSSLGKLFKRRYRLESIA